MKSSIPLLQFIGFLFTSIGGVLLHFLYDWTNESLLTAPFSAINESTWEHMKLLLAFVHFTFFPPELPLFQNPPDGNYGL